jgi:hypothetical protein
MSTLIKKKQKKKRSLSLKVIQNLPQKNDDFLAKKKTAIF